MPRATRRRSARDDEPARDDAPVTAPEAGVAEVLRLQRTAGNQAVAAALAARSAQPAGDRAGAQVLARKAAGAPPVKDRTRIDELAKQNVTPVERARAYAEIAGTQAVQMDPATVHVSAFYKDGVNLDALKQARNVPATTGFIDAANNFTGGAPPETAKGVAIVVNSNAARFEDEDYMVAAIRHEMVHARLMRLTLQHLTAWKQAPGGLSFTQYVDKRAGGADGALIKDRYFGGHMDETVAYAEGFLSAFFYAPTEEPQAGDRTWMAHLKGFTKEFETARMNSGGLPKNRTGVQESAIATREAANAVVPEAEKLVKEYCDAGGAARRKNLAAWMQRLYKSEGMHDAALKMIYRVASGGKAMPEPKR
jgi:hypothetical protein